MKIEKVGHIPTLDEYLTQNIENNNPKIKEIVDDFCDFPGPEKKDCQNEKENSLREKRALLLKSFKNRVDDIIIFNRYALHQYNINAENIGPKFALYDEEYGGMFSSILDKQDEEKIEYARLGFKNFDWVCELLNARKIADEGLIIHLWATIEQHVKRAILIMEESRKEMPYKWNELKRLSKEVGIDLESLPSYDIINEIRVVNNKIKHLYIVDKELCKYTGFAEHEGKKMSAVNYRTHEYALAAHHFMNRLVMAMGPVISYAPDRIIDENE
ncbi:hypothetical protein FE394_13105 [Xenorhabdus sp. Reich]|uniref:Uncharacterized protein n=1 Tax=Xenorhabdus littoralis TaxID=2582835 RepID=A0ABU4SN96_9GAMM|nr:hypothetical protein [Xenorhabdus sp. Reich]MDX8000120.1 hypothetical protein [Xenorhabdus sp. Reich]